jgi:hypothetical protein
MRCWMRRAPRAVDGRGKTNLHASCPCSARAFVVEVRLHGPLHLGGASAVGDALNASMRIYSPLRDLPS